MGGSSANRRKTRGRQTAQAAGILVVNMIPKALSGEAEQDSEPSLAVNPADPSQIVASAFTPDPLGGNLAPIFVSNDGGQTWTLRSTVPSNGITGDISIDFGGNGRLYGGILKLPGNLLLNLLRTANSFGTTPMTILSSRNRVDQPFVRSIAVNGRDRVYIGNNDFSQANGRTATIDVSLHGAAPTPQFSLVRIEHRSTGSAGQNGPQIRPAVHADGTVYATFYGWRSASPVTERITSDVIVVRDDSGATGPQAFTALVDPNDNLPGRIVASGSRIVFGRLMGNQRTGGDLSIATDPRDSQIVYVAWASIDPVTDYTLHVRRSADGGATWSANDLRTKARATNPALAINSAGKVCFLCQQLKGNGASARWVTTVERSGDDGVTWTSNTLATVPANAPSPQFQPYIGDYVGLTSVKKDFYGIFSANNSPDLARFPSGVIYQREHDFQTRRLFGVDGTTQVSISIDPFFFKITE